MNTLTQNGHGRSLFLKILHRQLIACSNVILLSQTYLTVDS